MALFAGLAFALAALVLGTLDAGLLIGWHQIDPGQVAWLRKDPGVYKAGWEFLRRAPWSFPPTWLAGLDYPFGISAAYLDVIPLVAVPFKVLSRILAQHFQYFGLYLVLCLVLQTWFGFRLMSRFTQDPIIILIGGLFFLNSPILLMRLFGHFSLCSQWLVVAALYFYFDPRPDAPGRLWPFAVLLVLSAGTSPYLSLMVFGIALAAIARWQLVPTNSESAFPEMATARSATSNAAASPIVSVAILVFCLLAALMFFGFVTPGSMPAISGGGYGAYSMNLLAPINPTGPSIIFRSFAVLPLQSYEGYNYLGVGVIGLGVLVLARNPSLLRQLWQPPLRPLVVICILFFAAAISVQIAVGTKVIALIPLPTFILNLLAIFRSSGRLFWPVHQLLMLGALVGTILTFRARWAARAALAVAFCIQFLDLLPMRQSIAHESALTEQSPLQSPIWWTLSKSNRHLIVLPARQCDPIHTPGGDPAWPWFADLAARSGMTLNSVHAARFSAQSDSYNCKLLPLELGKGKLESGTAYVLSDSLASAAAARTRTHVCRRVDAFNLCLSRDASESPLGQ